MGNHKIQIANGKLIDIFNFTTEDVDVKTIASHIAKKCRYNCASDFFYSVGQHSVLTSIAAQYTILNSKKYLNIEDETELEKAKMIYFLWRKTLKCLLHDAAEFIVPDLPRPLTKLEIFKPLLGLHDKILQTVYDSLGLGLIEDSFVQKMDDKMLETEKTFVIKPCAEWLDQTNDSSEKPFSDEIIDPSLRVGWNPEEAREKFMERYKEVWWNFCQAKRSYLELKEAHDTEEAERQTIVAEN